MLGGVTILVERKRLISDLESKAEISADYFALSLSYPIWNLVFREINNQLELFFLDTEAYAVILMLDGIEPGTIRIVRDDDWSTVEGKGDPAEHITTKLRSIMAEDKQIGSLELQYTFRFVHSLVRKTAILIVGVVLALDLILILALILILQIEIFKPLGRIESWAASVSNGGSVKIIDKEGFRGEIASLDGSISRMTQLLEQRLHLIEAGEREFRGLFENNPIPTWEFDFTPVETAICRTGGIPPSDPQSLRILFKSAKLLAANHVALASVGAPSAETSHELLVNGADEKTLAVLGSELLALCKGRNDAEGEGSICLISGEERTFRFRFASLPNNDGPWSVILLTASDITDQERSAQRLRAALAQKEVLAGELFHRTRNTLQLLSSMVSLRKERAKNTDSTDLLSIRTSIHTIALIQDKLLESGDISSIDLGPFFNDLAQYLIEETNMPRKIKINLEGKHVPVLIDVAMPLALAFCEIVSNAINHAFPNERKGTISIEISRDNEGNICLLINDDGIGPPPDFNPRTCSNLGLEIAYSLVEGQLKGSMSFNFLSGFQVYIRFNDSLFLRRV